MAIAGIIRVRSDRNINTGDRFKDAYNVTLIISDIESTNSISRLGQDEATRNCNDEFAKVEELIING